MEPSIGDLERVMALLGVPGDPVFILKDHDDARRRAELLARIAATVVDQLGVAEAAAGLDLDDRADLHRDADHDAAPARQLDLQLARLTWVQHAMIRRRGRHPDPVPDTVATALGALVQLVEAWRRVDPAPPDLQPLLADALLMVRDAADHLGEVLRSQRLRPRRTPVVPGRPRP